MGHGWARLYSRKLEAIELGRPSEISEEEFAAAWKTMTEWWRSR